MPKTGHPPRTTYGPWPEGTATLVFDDLLGLPGSGAARHCAQWCLERGYYRFAVALAGLAAELAADEVEKTMTEMQTGVARVPMLGSTRPENPSSLGRPTGHAERHAFLREGTDPLCRARTHGGWCNRPHSDPVHRKMEE